MLQGKLPQITKNRNHEERTMVCKQVALFAVVIASAIFGFSGVALAGDKATDAGGWATPNVPGMPGYKEPPKGPDEPKKPIPVPPADPNAASYIQRLESDSTKK
jgi:hypothetical protein